MPKVMIDGLDVLNDIQGTGTFTLLDTATDPTGEGEIQRNGNDIKIYAGSQVRSLANQQVSAGGAASKTSAPGVTNDLDEGYEPGSLWVDTNNDRVYVCLDKSDGAAVWIEITNKTITVAAGGTGATALADKAVLITQDSGTDTVTPVAMTTSGQLLIGGSSGPAVATLTPGANVTITNGNGTITLGVPVWKFFMAT